MLQIHMHGNEIVMRVHCTVKPQLMNSSVSRHLLGHKGAFYETASFEFRLKNWQQWKHVLRK